MAERTIWGISVETSPSGRASWPNEIKRIAVERVLEMGERIAMVASELEAHENLVRKWCIAARRARGETVAQQPRFAPVMIASDQPPATPAMICKLTIDNATLEFPSNIAEDDLVRLVRGPRGA
jgi:transposase-like protein